MSDSRDEAEGSRLTVSDPEVLWEGPLFADEIAWPGGITDALVEQYDLDARRLVLAKEANKGVCSIYFRVEHWQEALIRYADRYRPLLELILRQGLSGERRLLQQGWLDEDIDFLFEIIPGLEQNEHSPVVYKLVLQSLTIPVYIDIAQALQGKSRFTPQEVLEQVAGVDTDDAGLFNPFIRHHLIETTESMKGSDHYRGKRQSTKIGTALDKEYRLTSEGNDAIPAVAAVYEAMIERQTFEPLQAALSDATDHLPKTGSHSEETQEGLVQDLLEDISANAEWDEPDR